MLRRTLALLGLVSILSAAAASGCGDVTCESCGDPGGAGGSTSSSSGAPCTKTTGDLHGAVAIGAAPGPPNSQPAPLALVQLRQMPGDSPILAMADDHGSYSVELAAGSWIVGGESADGYCQASMMQTVEVIACASAEITVVLDECIL